MTVSRLINNCLQSLQEQGALDLDDQDITEISNNPAKGTIYLKGTLFQHKTFREVGPQQVGQLTVGSYHHQPLLIMADYITPKAKAALRKANVNYIECSGNAFIQTDSIYVFIDTNRKGSQIEHNKPKRGISKAGVKVIYQFLCDPKLLNETQRTIALKADTALGSIPGVIKSLMEEGLLLKSKKGLILDDYEALLAKWIQAYYEILQPRLFFGRFKPRKPESFYTNWQQLELTPETEWGGEPAGALLTNYLKPKVFTLYTKTSSSALIRHYKWEPDEEGPIHVYQSFWQAQSAHHPAVHPVLAYADLVNTGDQRCWETAQKIYESYVRAIANQAV